MSTLRPRVTYGSQHTVSTFARPAHDRELTHERIAADLAEFSKAGGHIEVLGTTPLRRKSDRNETSAAGGGASPGKSTSGHDGD